MALNFLYKQLVFAVFMFCMGITGFAQTNISGVINKYAAVSTIDFCENSVQVAALNGFTVGQKVMLIQMKGAQVDASNTAAYGSVTSYAGCGNYELNEIGQINGNVIVFRYALQRAYEAGGAVQLISLEEYTSAVVNAPLTAKAWDGSTGGVLLLKANTLTLNDSITVKGKGFRGATKENDGASQACFNNGVGGATDVYCATIACGAPKGEGIGNAGFGYGAGKNGNGGGGGNDHNTGGGGGSNYGAGGFGGRRANASNFSCPGPLPGFGGQALAYNNTNGKIFMGGGGGAGDGNNNESTGGANGGGIVIIMANTLTGNNKKINAAGDAVATPAGSDGAGGGGGGGTVLLYVDNYSGTLQVNTTGGNGGILDNGGTTFCMGPGGGGGGGAVWVKTPGVPANINLVDSGGFRGFNYFGLGPSNCPYGVTNGSTSGTAGGTVTNLTIVNDTVPFIRLGASACCDTTVCAGAVVQLTVTDTAAVPPTIAWSTGENTHTITPQVLASTTYSVTVSDNRGCNIIRQVNVTVQNALPNVIVCCDTEVCRGAPVPFSAEILQTGNYTFRWNTGETTDAITKFIISPSTFTVTVTDANGCSVAKSVNATISNNPPVISVCCDTTVCAGSVVNFTAVTPGGNFNYVWNTGETTAGIAPTVLGALTYIVTATDANGCSASASAQANINSAGPQLTVCCDTLVCSGNQANFSASSTAAVTYNWSTGQTTASITTPVAVSGIIYVTATDANGCVGIKGVNANAVNAQVTITAVPDTAIYAGQSVQLTASTSPGFSYTWSPVASLSSGSIYNPVASPVATTTYCLTVIDNYGCPASDCIDVNIISTEIAIKVPDAFAPNGNNPANHVFTIFPIGDTRVAEIKIYNRWGEVVFSAQSNIAWDGTYQGKLQPAGAYVCRIIYGSAAEPNSKTLTRDFLLIR